MSQLNMASNKESFFNDYLMGLDFAFTTYKEFIYASDTASRIVTAAQVNHTKHFPYLSEHQINKIIEVEINKNDLTSIEIQFFNEFNNMLKKISLAFDTKSHYPNDNFNLASIDASKNRINNIQKKIIKYKKALYFSYSEHLLQTGMSLSNINLEFNLSGYKWNTLSPERSVITKGVNLDEVSRGMPQVIQLESTLKFPNNDREGYSYEKFITNLPVSEIFLSY